MHEEEATHQPQLTRRGFVKAAGATGLAGAILGAGLGTWDGFEAHAAEPNTEGDDEKIIRSACRNCYGRCTINGYVRNGRLTRIEPCDGTYSEGTVCSRAFAIPQLMYSPKRITYPMQQVGERGKGEWKRITWDEAWDVIVPEIKDAKDNYGGNSIMFNNGTGRDQLNIHVMQKVFNDMGSVGGFGVGSVCKMGGDGVQRTVIGNACSFGGWDAENSNLVLWWGRGLFAWGYYDWLVLQKAKKNSAKLIVVDPRYTAAAMHADLWLPIRQGSDVALALTLVNEMLSSKRFAQDFAAEWTNAGFFINPDTGLLLRESDIVAGGSPTKCFVWDETSQSAQTWDTAALAWSAEGVKPALFGSFEVAGKTYKTVLEQLAEEVKMWTPEKAAEVTWLPVEKINEFIEMYLKNSPGTCFTRGQKLDMSQNASGMSHLINIFMALAGNYETEGGNWVKPLNKFLPPVMFHMMTPFPDAKKETMAKIDEKAFGGATAKIYGQLYGYPASAMKVLSTNDPFEPRVYWSHNSEAIMMCPGSKDVAEAINKVHFSVNCNYYMTPSGELADIFLPAAHQNEVDRIEYPSDAKSMPAFQTATIRQPFVDPPGDCMDEVDIMFELARRLDMPMTWKDKFDWFDKALSPSKITYQQFKDEVQVITSEAPYRKYEKGLLRNDKRIGFDTPTGKVDIFSDAMERFGHSGMPSYIEQPYSPFSEPELYGDGEGEFPLILMTGGRTHQYFHTEYRDSAWMRSLHPFPLVEIHPETAERFGIEDGDWITIESPHGKITQKANITAGLDPRTIHCEHDWWFPEMKRDEEMHGAWISNCNMLLPSPDKIPFDPATGALPYHTLVRISKADGIPEGIYATLEDLQGFLPKSADTPEGAFATIEEVNTFTSKKGA